VHKYEWDGPKNQFDENQLSEFYEKMINDHPLLEYIEDPFAKGDVKAIKKFIGKLQVSHPGVRVGINSMFQSNLETIKNFTLMIVEDSDDE
jgi:enolase